MTDQSSNQNFLSIKSKTWTRDSHGLFDYESNTVKENILIIQNPTILIRKKHDLKELEAKDEETVKDDNYDQKICDVILEDNSKLLRINLIY